MIADAPPVIRDRQPQRETSAGSAKLSVIKGGGAAIHAPIYYSPLSASELQVIEDMRKLSERGRASVVSLIGGLLDREDSERLLEEGLLLSAESFLRDEQERDQGS
jgi:hypothetical protein